MTSWLPSFGGLMRRSRSEVSELLIISKNKFDSIIHIPWVLMCVNKNFFSTLKIFHETSWWRFAFNRGPVFVYTVYSASLPLHRWRWMIVHLATHRQLWPSHNMWVTFCGAKASSGSKVLPGIKSPSPTLYVKSLLASFYLDECPLLPPMHQFAHICRNIELHNMFANQHKVEQNCTLRLYWSTFFCRFWTLA